MGWVLRLTESDRSSCLAEVVNNHATVCPYCNNPMKCGVLKQSHQVQMDKIRQSDGPNNVSYYKICQQVREIKI